MLKTSSLDRRCRFESDPGLHSLLSLGEMMKKTYTGRVIKNSTRPLYLTDVMLDEINGIRGSWSADRKRAFRFPMNSDLEYCLQVQKLFPLSRMIKLYKKQDEI